MNHAEPVPLEPIEIEILRAEVEEIAEAWRAYIFMLLWARQLD